MASQIWHLGVGFSDFLLVFAGACCFEIIFSTLSQHLQPSLIFFSFSDQTSPKSKLAWQKACETEQTRIDKCYLIPSKTCLLKKADFLPIFLYDFRSQISLKNARETSIFWLIWLNIKQNDSKLLLVCLGKFFVCSSWAIS